MKKLLHILILFCGTLPGVFAQSNNCGSTSPEIESTVEARELCEGVPTDVTISTSSNLPDTEFFLVDVDQAGDDLGDNTIVAISSDGVFIPEDYDLTYNQRFAIRPFSCDIAQFRELIDVVRTATTTTGTTCCEEAEDLAKDFCSNLTYWGFESGEDINNMSDVWRILDISAGNSGSSFSVEGFVLQINTLKFMVDNLPEACRYNSDYCYAVGNNEQLFRILETPDIVEVMTDVPDEITISSTISDGTLEYSIDQNEWQTDNTIRDTPSEGVAYVRKIDSECVEQKSFFNSNLNVELSDFKATDEATTNLLYWVTDTEIDNAGFSIERSTDAENFTKIAWVDGAGDSQVPIAYTFRDMSPLTGTSYYRLGMEDMGGRVEYSDKKSVQRNDGTGFSILSIGPNPSANILNVSILNEEELGDVDYLIYDLMGRKVRYGTRELTLGINNFSVDAAMMGTGMYLFIATKGDYVSSTFKFVMH